MSEQWYYSRDGQRYGPLSTEQLRQLATARRLLPTDVLWKNGMNGWAAASTIPGLFAGDALDNERTARTPAAPVARIADALDVQATARSIADAPPRRPPGGDALDVQATARPIAAAPAQRSPLTPTPLPQGERGGNVASPLPSGERGNREGGDDLDRQVTARTANGPPVVQARPASTADLKGQTIDKYLITKRLGEGGMGVVYKATDDSDVEYAIKVLTPALCADPRSLADLKKEVANSQALTHQNLLKINYFSTVGSLNFIVMEYIDGDTLEEYRLRKGRTIPAEDFKKIAPQILSGLEYLHEKGVVHRDIKPQNIMIARNGDIKITDYGIALSIKEQLRRGSEVEAMGTLAYSAPEQTTSGNVVDRRADIYAVGMMFHRLVSGQFPFNEKDKNAIVAWHKDPRHQIVNLGSAALNSIVQRCLAVDPARRFTSCAEVLRELAAAGLVEGSGEVAPARATSAREIEIEKLLGLTRLIRQQMQKRFWECIFDGNFPKVFKREDGSYEMPGKGAAGLLKGMAKSLAGEVVNPVEELAAGLVAGGGGGTSLDPRLEHNTQVIREEAQKEAGRLFPQAVYIGLMVLAFVLFMGGAGGMAAGGAGLGIGYFLMLGSLFLPLWAIGAFRRRRFLDDVIDRLKVTDSKMLY